MAIIACPECGVAPEPGESLWTCPYCGAGFPSLPGLVRIYPGIRYQEDLARDAVLVMLEKARQSSWREAVDAARKKHGWTIAEALVNDAGRADWFPEVPYGRGMRALEIGSGWGQLAFLLAERVDEVYSLEPVVEKADFQQIRREQDQVSNLMIVNSRLAVLPFQSNCFDMIVLNGVLNRTGRSATSRRSREIQLSVLTRVRKLLRPGGYVYFGIENRIVWRGRKERTAAHTPRGYRKLLQEAGFRDTRISWVSPHYNKPLESARLESPYALRFYAHQEGQHSARGKVKNVLVKVATQFGLEKYLMPYLSIVAYADGEPYPSLLESVCHRLRERGIPVRADQVLRYSSTSYGASPRGRIKYILFDDRTHQPLMVAKIPRARLGAALLKQESRVFSQIAAMSPWLIKQRGSHYLQVEGIPVLCERFFAGKKFNAFLLSERPYTVVMDWLSNLHKSVLRDTKQISVVQIARDYAERVLSWKDVEPAVNRYLGQWLDAVSNLPHPRARCVPQHGDFTIGNVLLSDDEIFVTDWERAQIEAPPWEDFWTFLISCALNTSPKGTIGRRKPEYLLASLKGDSAHSKFITLASARFLEKSNLPRNVLLGGLLPTILSRLSQDVEGFGLSPDKSHYYQLLAMAARDELSLWDCVDRLLPACPVPQP